MGQLPQTPSSHPYSLSLQLKLYQAFIFSVPILFTIILFLLFYLFYLKRRGSSAPSSTPNMHPRSFSRATTGFSSPLEKGMKEDLKEILPAVIFDEDLKERDTLCCVCLGDFEIKEQLHQIPSCKHMFHLDCIHLWLMSNTTCPLCRASVLPLPVKMEPPIRINMSQASNAEFGSSAQQGPQGQLTIHVVDRMSEERLSSIGGSTGRPCLTELRNSQVRDGPIDAGFDHLHGRSVAVQIQIHEV